MTKIAVLPEILLAAQVLFRYGLITEHPADVVKRYVVANPDINKVLSTHKTL